MVALTYTSHAQIVKTFRYILFIFQLGGAEHVPGTHVEVRWQRAETALLFTLGAPGIRVSSSSLATDTFTH